MDDTDFIIPGRQDAAKSIPQFYTEPTRNNFKSEQAGRPVFEDREFVRVLIVGDRRTQPVYEVTDEHRERWAREYAAFKAGQEPPLEGTPLANWPPIGAARAKEFALMNIKTVEQLAGVGDNIVQNLGMGGRELREQARVFLDVARNGTAPIAKLIDDNAALKGEVARLSGIVSDLSARVQAKEARHDA